MFGLGRLFRGKGESKQHSADAAISAGKPDAIDQAIAAADQAAENISRPLPAREEVDLFAAGDDDSAWGAPRSHDNLLDDSKPSMAEMTTNVLATDSLNPDRYIDPLLNRTMDAVEGIAKTDQLRAAQDSLKKLKQTKSQDQARISEVQQEIRDLNMGRQSKQLAYKESNEQFWRDVDERRGRPGGAYDQLRAHAELTDEERQAKEQSWEDSAAKLRAVHGYRASAKLPQPAKLPWGQRVKNWFSRK